MLSLLVWAVTSTIDTVNCQATISHGVCQIGLLSDEQFHYTKDKIVAVEKLAHSGLSSLYRNGHPAELIVWSCLVILVNVTTVGLLVWSQLML